MGADERAAALFWRSQGSGRRAPSPHSISAGAGTKAAATASAPERRSRPCPRLREGVRERGAPGSDAGRTGRRGVHQFGRRRIDGRSGARGRGGNATVMAAPASLELRGASGRKHLSVISLSSGSSRFRLWCRRSRACLSSGRIEMAERAAGPARPFGRAFGQRCRARPVSPGRTRRVLAGEVVAPHTLPGELERARDLLDRSVPRVRGRRGRPRSRGHWTQSPCTRC